MSGTARLAGGLMLGFGLAFLLVTPPLQVPDELVHFYRAFQLSEGYPIGGVHARIPWSFYDFNAQVLERIESSRGGRARLAAVSAELSRPLRLDHRATMEFRAVTLYPPLPYVPQASAVLAGTLVQAPPVVLLYLGRLANLVAAAAITMLALHVAPAFRSVLLLTALSPMALSLAASNSPDATANALGFLFVALLLRAASRQGPPMSVRDVTMLVLVGVLLALCKQVYAVLPVLYLAVPIERAGGRRRFVLVGLVLAVSVAAALVSWNWCVRGLFVPQYPGVSPAGQLVGIMHDPAGYVRVIMNTLRVQGWQIAEGSVGVLGRVETFLPAWVYVSFPLALLSATLLSPPASPVIYGWRRLVPLGTGAVTILAVLTSGYLFWGVVGATEIVGIQGRYFVLVLPVLLLSLYDPVAPASRLGQVLRRAVAPWVDRLAPWYAAAVLTAALTVLLRKYYLA